MRIFKMEYEMSVYVLGASSIEYPEGQFINNVFALLPPSTSELANSRGYRSSRISCEKSVLNSLPADISDYPKVVTVIAVNRSKRGESVPHILSVK